jgi:predicted transcriptional regulator
LEKQILNVNDIAKILEISEAEAEKLIKKLEYKKIAGKYFTTLDSLKKWISYSLIPFLAYHLAELFEVCELFNLELSIL